ncbi:unnamed protein product [Sphagnum jensenii]|uniref:Acid phosphatase n=1 Tax=Sphagnum jensenii TaxID=128206 RepID=A0ABP0WEK8_9BRYO
MASTLEHIAGYDYHILLFAGDLSYADKNQFLWDTFGHMVSACANYQPWMVTEGNHEIKDNPLMESFVSTTPAGTCLTRRADHVQTCTIRSKLQGFTFRCLDLTLTSIQILHNINGFSDGSHGVYALQCPHNIVFAGHLHAYEHIERVHLKQSDPCGILYITIGDGGNIEGLARIWLDPQFVWSMFQESSFRHGELKIVNATHAYWSWNRNHYAISIMADDVCITSLSAAQSGCIPSSTMGC